MHFQDIFPHIFVINVDQTSERWKLTESMLKDRSISFDRIQGIVPNEGKTRADRDLGCFLSHRKCIEEAKKQDFEYVLVLEDDAYFCPNLNIDSYLSNIAAFVYSASWETLYLGGNHERTPFKTTYPGIVKVLQTKTTHAICYHNSAYNRFLDAGTATCPIDDFDIQTFQVRGMSYCTTPRLIAQRPGKSIILNDFRDNTSCLIGD